MTLYDIIAWLDLIHFFNSHLFQIHGVWTWKARRYFAHYQKGQVRSMPGSGSLSLLTSWWWVGLVLLDFVPLCYSGFAWVYNIDYWSNPYSAQVESEYIAWSWMKLVSSPSVMLYSIGRIHSCPIWWVFPAVESSLLLGPCLLGFKASTPRDTNSVRVWGAQEHVRYGVLRGQDATVDEVFWSSP